MTETEQINIISMFLSALIVTSGYRTAVPFNTLKFGELVTSLPDNLFAKKFTVTKTPVGPRCRDFREGISIAQNFGLVVRDVSNPPTIMPKLDIVQVAEFEKDAELFDDAKKFVTLYLERTKS
ncbi:hypothetical protein M0R72_01945 [Candidatus Pacearchaeota archaeon]|jgi:hypothetical protein|nr:hypothetical protein [Candidatus Pacearchaeota archaeon]